jgi:hypothetical protein
LYPVADDPINDLFGVRLKIYIKGNVGETGRVRIDWGDYVSETFDVAHWALQLGANTIGNSLPIGTHEICAEVI